jgi:hypothetical protein
VIVTHEPASGPDVVTISQNKTLKPGDLDLLITPKNLGENVQYYIALDNGVALDNPLIISVKESLSSAFVETTNNDGLIKIPSEEENTFYLYNDGVNVDGECRTKTIAFHVYANGNRQSKAIKGVDVRLSDSSVFALYSQSASGKEFHLQIRHNGKLISSAAESFEDKNENGIYDDGDILTDTNGNGEYDGNIGLVAEVRGYTITGFKQEDKVIRIPLNLYAYSFIEGIKVETKGAEGDAVEANTGARHTHSNKEVLDDFGINYAKTRPTFRSDSEGKTNVIAFQEDVSERVALLRTEVFKLISAIPKFSIAVVDELPEENISETTVYLVRNLDGIGDDAFKEYIYVDEEWELLGAQIKLITDVTPEQPPLVGGSGIVIEVESIEGGHRVTITDAEGTQSFDVLDGKDGVNGKDGADGEKGDKGDKGDKGEDGKDGKDYILTSADKTEIANAVLDSLTVAEGGLY